MSGDSARETVGAADSPLGCRCNPMKTRFLPAFASTHPRNAYSFARNAPPFEVNALPFAAERYLFATAEYRPEPNWYLVAAKPYVLEAKWYHFAPKLYSFGANGYLFVRRCTRPQQTGTCLPQSCTRLEHRVPVSSKLVPVYGEIFPFSPGRPPFPRKTQTNALNSYYDRSNHLTSDVHFSARTAERQPRTFRAASRELKLCRWVRTSLLFCRTRTAPGYHIGIPGSRWNCPSRIQTRWADPRQICHSPRR